MDSKRSESKLKVNVISSSLYQVIVMIVPIITSPYVTRIFSVNQMGDYSLSLTIANIFVVIAQFGLSTYAIREIAILNSVEARSKEFFKLESIQIVTSILSFIVYNFIFIVILDTDAVLLYFIQSLLIIINIFDISWYYVGIEEIGKIIVRNGMTKVLSTLLIFLIIKDPDQLELYALINVVGILSGNVLMVIQSRRFLDFSVYNFSISWNHVVGSLKYLVPTVINFSYDSIEKSLLKVVSNSSNVGIYSEAKKIINMLNSVINSAFSALSPRMSHFVSIGNISQVREYFDRGVNASSIFSIIVVGGVIVVGDDFVNFFYGSGYDLVSPVLKISSISLIIIPINVLISRGLLIPYGMEKIYSKSIIYTLLSGIVFNIIFNINFGALGAALSFVLSQIVCLVYAFKNIHNMVPLKSVIQNIFISILCILLQVVTTNEIKSNFVIENSIISFIVFGVISVAVSSLLLVIIFILKKEIIKSKNKHM